MERLPQLYKDREYWIEERAVARRLEITAQKNIERISDEISAARLYEKTGSPLDIPPLKQSLKEMLADKILRALDRLPH